MNKLHNFLWLSFTETEIQNFSLWYLKKAGMDKPVAWWVRWLCGSSLSPSSLKNTLDMCAHIPKILRGKWSMLWPSTLEGAFLFFSLFLSVPLVSSHILWKTKKKSSWNIWLIKRLHTANIALVLNAVLHYHYSDVTLTLSKEIRQKIKLASWIVYASYFLLNSYVFLF